MIQKQLAVFVCLLLMISSFAQGIPVQVKTAKGMLEGLKAEGVTSFKGVPFAAPPIGALRWKAPQPLPSWAGVRRAYQFAAKPMQTNVYGDMNSRSNGMSEDCLYLNIWMPQAPSKAALPVLVYFYGGGFIAGDASEPRYDGESMARRGIVTVTVNYRLGVFGFLAHPELSAEAPYHASGNYGLLDQAAALKWVYENIASFGGDPKRITIAGESAGSISVSAQMASPLSKDLLAGAIGESGSLLGAFPPVSLENGETTGKQFAQLVHAGSLQALREMNADTLLQAAARSGAYRFSSVVDGYFFPESPKDIYAKGNQASIPLLAGWNNEEMNYRMILGNEKPTITNYEKAVRRLYGSDAAAILEVYKAGTDEAVEQVATDLAGDRFISFSTWQWIDVHSKTGAHPVFRYYYTKARPAMTPQMAGATPGLAGGIQKTAKAKPAPASKGAVHSAEIEYAMGNLSTNKVYAWTEDDYKVSKTMQAYFEAFIKNGNPAAPTLPTWLPSTSKKPMVMYIDVDSRLKPAVQENRYELLRRLSEKK
ncbi:carboxylesterase/lipase family protein [Filimonas effusa]|uniref:Carboxylic ester hydrolase n=1 Tax=Filimonas effusa TaxID=2508721 RepID=A0A4Q1D9E6_9BACT|nr:carboxylesterase family protein [Filimonas effusa]RXK86007.1 carboxylesterase family protein [Filimonas effusa]